jgi:predicted nucleic acid-binding protein
MLIVDASVAVKWVLEENGSPEAVALARQDTLAEPEFWLLEAANVLWKRSRRGELTAAEAGAALEILDAAPVAPIRLTDVLPEAIRFAFMLDHPVYDCVYIAAAVLNGAVLVTGPAAC